MKTKEEYEKALKEINDAFYGANFLNNQTRIFDDNLNLLRELVNEHFEEKKESNLEHYKEEIKYAGYEFALVNGKPTTCRKSLCEQCYFNDKCFTCSRKRMEWMLDTCKQKYRLTRFEHELLQMYSDDYVFKDLFTLNSMKEKGLYQNVNGDELIKDILANCEVTK